MELNTHTNSHSPMFLLSIFTTYCFHVYMWNLGDVWMLPMYYATVTEPKKKNKV